MPLYHFNLMAGVTRVLDPRGTYLPDDDAARRYAKQLVRAQLVQGPQWSIEVQSRGSVELRSIYSHWPRNVLQLLHTASGFLTLIQSGDRPER
jgi:hypothetical protein